MLRSAPLRIPYGGVIESSQLNRWSELVIADLQEATDLQKQAADQASLVTLLQSYEDLFLTFQREETAREFRLLRREIQAMELQAGRVNIEVPAAEIMVDEGQLYGPYGLVLPSVKLSVDRIPADAKLDITVTPNPDGVLIRDSATNAIIDHRYDTVWLRTVSVPMDDLTATVEATVEFDLPEYVPTTRLNLLSFLPFPSWGLELESADALTDSGVWQPLDINQTLNGPRMSLFEPVHTRRIRLLLRQRHALTMGDRRVFVLGLRDLSAVSATFGDVIRLRVPLRLPRAGMWVTGVEIMPLQANAQIQVQVDGNEILPAFIAGEEAEIAVTIRGSELGPVQGVRVVLAP